MPMCQCLSMTGERISGLFSGDCSMVLVHTVGTIASTLVSTEALEKRRKIRTHTAVNYIVCMTDFETHISLHPSCPMV